MTSAVVSPSLDRTKTLVIDVTNRPIALISWKEAISMVHSNRATSMRNYEIEVKSERASLHLPAVLKVNYYLKFKKVPLSRSTILCRDKYKCCYCGKKYSESKLSLDHVIPRFLGGGWSWENLVASCLRCNRKKDNRTPQQAGLPMLNHPHEPKWNPIFLLRTEEDMVEAWRPWLISEST